MAEYLSDEELQDLHLSWAVSNDDRCFIGTALIEELLELRALVRANGIDEEAEGEFDLVGMNIITPNDWDEV